MRNWLPREFLVQTPITHPVYHLTLQPGPVPLLLRPSPPVSSLTLPQRTAWLPSTGTQHYLIDLAHAAATVKFAGHDLHVHCYPFPDSLSSFSFR